MKRLYSSTILILLLTIGIACTKKAKESQTVVQEEEIKNYLTENSFRSSTGLENTEMNIEFWKDKLETSPNSMTYHSKLAGAYAARFGITKDIEDLQKADSLYRVALNLPGGKNVENLQALSQLAITKHQFPEAQELAVKALEIGDKKASSHMLIFDAMMERGDYELARQHLGQLKNKSSFSFQVRLSKYMDYEGKLDSAIHHMERAYERIGHDHKMRAWSQSNLGDMYGHANLVQKSYESYLKVLQGEQAGGSWLHSLQGIAWIAYAHDDNPELAQKILAFIDSRIESPDMKLRLAELAEYQNKSENKEQYLQAFVKEARKPAYYGIYDAYLIKVAATEMNNYDWAMELVTEELKNRPNPIIFDLKALTYLQMGEAEKALDIIEKKVKGHTHEPVPALHMAKVYKANGWNTEARKYFKEALAAGYELGPVATGNIKQELSEL